MFTDFESCPVCKGAVTVRTVDGQWRPYCLRCQVILQLGPKLVATVLIGDSSNLLMVQRSYGEEKGRWALPGGYVEQGEVVEEAAAREALEETGLQGGHHRPRGPLLRPRPSHRRRGLRSSGRGRRPHDGVLGDRRRRLLPYRQSPASGLPPRRPHHRAVGEDAGAPALVAVE